MNFYGGVEPQSGDAQLHSVYDAPDHPVTPVEADARAANTSRSRFGRTVGLTLGASAALAALYAGLHQSTLSSSYDSSLAAGEAGTATPSANVAQRKKHRSSSSDAAPTPVPTASTDLDLSFSSYNEYTLNTPITPYIWDHIVEPFRMTTFEAEWTANATMKVSVSAGFPLTSTCAQQRLTSSLDHVTHTHLHVHPHPQLQSQPRSLAMALTDNLFIF